MKLPEVGSHLQLSLPAPKVLLVCMNRPDKLNAMNDALHNDMTKAFDFFEREPTLWVCVLTGNGRAFCAGQDLASLLESKRTGDGETALFREMRTLHHPNGFGGMSLRRFSKPIIAAAQGGAYGGGCEILLNCDMVIAGDSVKIALPEPKRGVAALAGGIPRLFHIAGHQLAAEMMFTGRVITAQEARDRFKFVNYVVPDKDVLTVALDWAKQMVACSPDAVQVTKEAMNFAQYDMLNSTEVACTTARSVQGQALMSGENCKEGLVAFEERRETRWKDPPSLYRQSKL